MTFVLVSVLYKHVCECIDDPFATPVTDATVAITDDEPNERIEVDNAAVSFTAGELNGTAAMEQAPDPAEKR